MENAFNDPGIPWKGISELVERSGACGSKREFLSSLLDGLDGLIPHDMGSGLLRADGQYVASRGFDRETIRKYNEYYVNKWNFLPQPLNEAIVSGSRYELLPVKWYEYPDTEFVADFCRPLRLDTTLTYFLPRGTLSLIMHRTRKARPFDDTEKTTLRVLNAHMNNYLALHEKTENLSPRVPDPADIRNRFPALSRRENEVVRQTCMGLSAALVARRSGVSRRTVESQLQSAYRKIDVNTKKELVERVIDCLSGKESDRLSGEAGPGPSPELESLIF